MPSIDFSGICVQWRIQEWPDGERRPQRKGCQPNILADSLENCMKTKKIGPLGATRSWRHHPHLNTSMARIAISKYHRLHFYEKELF